MRALRLLPFLLIGTIAVIASPARSQDVTAGERLFKTQCASCHSIEPGKNMVGPSLFGVVGRHSSQVPGFRYSAANQKADLTFDAATLDRSLTAPKEVVPATTMPYMGMKDAANRANLIAFLGTKK